MFTTDIKKIIGTIINISFYKVLIHRF